ncbi:hypothetical protein ACFLSJ_01685 [Verrucomicrobiota bacterium]
MADLKFACPHCGEHVLASDKMSGLEADCPHCSQPFVIPGPAELGEGMPSAPSSDQVAQEVGRTRQMLTEGYILWLKGQEDESYREQWPAQELVGDIEAEERLEWFDRWQAAGGKLHSGRFVAAKNDPVWVGISAFGLPFPPFDLGSALGVDDIAREEAVTLDVIERGDEIPPPSHTFSLDAFEIPDEAVARYVERLKSSGS